PVAAGVEGAEQGGDVVGALVGNQHVGDTIVVDVLDGHADRVRAHRVGDRGGEGGVAGRVEAGGPVDQDFVAAAGQHHGVDKGAALIQFGPLDGAGGQGAVASVGEGDYRGELRCAGLGRLDGDAVGLLVGDQDIGLPLAKVLDGQGDAA